MNFDENDYPKIISHFGEQTEAGKKEAGSHCSEITFYNPTRPLCWSDKRCLLVRVEPIHSEDNSKVMFFEDKNSDGVWTLLRDAPVFGLQDPFYCENVGGYNIIGGVKISQDQKDLDYQTVFYRYKETIFELIDQNGVLGKPFAKGPSKMKDIRLIGLKNGMIGVFTRPQGGLAGLGQIGYIEIENLEQLEDAISKAKLIDGLFADEEWGGANELHMLPDGKIGVLGHVAHFEEGAKHYYAISFVFDPESQSVGDTKLLSTADNFPSVPVKKSDLGKVIFSGGLERNQDGTAYLYAGIGDTNAGRILIEDPFGGC